MGYRLLDHTTDVIVEVEAASMSEAFCISAEAAIDITLDRGAVCEIESRRMHARGDGPEMLLYAWLEEVVYMMITEGFAIHRVEADVGEGSVSATAYGEPLDVARHGFRVEIKAPTLHGMVVRDEGGVLLRFLLDL